MSLRVKRDADNKYYVYVDWNPWIDAQAKVSPNGPALTVTISAVSWDIPAALTEESDTPNNAVAGITYFSGSGGVNGVSYPITCTVTYTALLIDGLTSMTAMTQDQSLSLILEQQ